MEFQITDLLDDLQDTSVDIRTETDASARRIKELTMKKIHAEKKTKRRGLPTLLKIALVAAVIASLAIPVMAATGFRFTDWLAGLNNADYREWQAHYESWENTEGFWQVNLTARNLTREGMTLSVREAQDTPVTGSLTMHGDYWLEKWNGEAFEKMTAGLEIPAGEDREIKDGDKFELEVNWVDAYGQLESGRYRLCKTFTYTYSDGKTAELTDWADFRIFNEDMTPYIEKCKAALDELLNRESSHISLAQYSIGESPENVTEQINNEFWRSGDKYLLVRDFQNDFASGRYGELLLGDEGYFINSWNNDDVTQGAQKWEYDDLVSPDLNGFDLWHFWLSFDDSQVGEIWVEENTISLTCVAYPQPDRAVYTEYIFSFDDAGKLVGGELWNLLEDQGEKWIQCKMTAYDTSAAEIAQVIYAQNVSTPKSFTWAEEKAQHPAGTSGVKTSGFVNTTPVTIESGYDAFMRAFNDYDAIAKAHHASEVSYDAEADMWKVEFWWKNGNVDCIIYMDGNGVTQMIVTGPYEG